MSEFSITQCEDMKTILFYIAIACFFGLSAVDSLAAEILETAYQSALRNSIAEIKLYPELHLTSMRLQNGMTVWLKPTDFETDEVFIKLSSNGGYASLNPDERAAGELAAQIAWESGLDGLTSDQMSVRLYEHSLEFVVKIEAFSRIIEGTSGKYGLDEFLKCINIVFTQHRLTQDGMRAAIANAKCALSKIDCDHERSYENALLNVNTQGYRALQPLSLEDLKKVDLEKAKEFFKKCFSDPSNFVCVIVGSFNLEEAQTLIDKYLGGIPRKDSNEKTVETSFPVFFPKGVTNKKIPLIGRADCLTRLTFPLEIKLDENNIFIMEFMCQIIEARLRRIITGQMQLSHGVDVSYHFPLYPLLDSPWVSVRFRSDLKHVDMLKELILVEIKHLQEAGATDKEMHEIKRLQKGSEEFWLKDNFYWVSMLTNYYLWKWDPSHISTAQRETQTLGLKTVNVMLKSAFSTTNYSTVTGTPAKN